MSIKEELADQTVCHEGSAAEVSDIYCDILLAINIEYFWAYRCIYNVYCGAISEVS